MVTGLLDRTVPVSIVGCEFHSAYPKRRREAIAVDSETRSPLFPDVPTLRSLASPISRGVFRLRRAHRHAKGHHPEAARRDRRDRQRARLPQKRLVDIGIVPVFDTPAHFADYLKVQGQWAEAHSGVRVSAALTNKRTVFCLRGRGLLLVSRQERLQRPLDRAREARVIVLPPSVQVCVPLS